ncbi:guanylate kinase [Bacillus phage Stills]|uniref:Guanylate kinase n=1 Tax=Bacillus phage Stills TaxID=1610833 RepID=A0A0E3X9J6_9CAUD|nr:guanylate kinase [Bacillus phage Stills]AKC02702.1 guanylate kinase [Bacillus phage Stills]
MTTFLKGQDRIVCLVGKSGTGKSTIAKDLERYGLSELKSYTSREPRFEGEDTHEFVTPVQSTVMVHNEEIIAYTRFDGHDYFATLDQMVENDIYVIDPAGVEFLSEKVGRENIMVIYIESSLWKRFRRMRKDRGFKHACQRIWHDRKAFQFIDYDKKIRNNNLCDLFYAPIHIVRWVKIWR